MHDLDRTLREFEAGIDALESGEFEYEGWSDETYGDGSQGEMDELELAANLLEITDEQELEQFFGSLVRAAGAFAGSPAGKALVGVLKNAAGRALPSIGGAIGNAIGGNTGQRLGQQAGRWAKGALGWELEGMGQDQEFEVAQGLVRIATTAAQQAAQRPSSGSPVAAAKQAAISAAQQVAPQLTRLIAAAGAAGSVGQGTTRGARSGRWVRRGNAIVILGV